MATEHVRWAATRRVGGLEGKAALILLAALANDAGRVLLADVERAFDSAEMTRAAFTGALKLLRDGRLIEVVTTKDLAGKRSIAEIRLITSAPKGDDPSVTIDDGSPKARMWSEATAFLRSYGMADAQARAHVGRLLKLAKNDAGTVLHAIEAAREARPFDPIPWLTAALKPKDNTTNGSSLTAAAHRLRERIAGRPVG